MNIEKKNKNKNKQSIIINSNILFAGINVLQIYKRQENASFTYRNIEKPDKDIIADFRFTKRKQGKHIIYPDHNETVAAPFNSFNVVLWIMPHSLCKYFSYSQF